MEKSLRYVSCLLLIISSVLCACARQDGQRLVLRAAIYPSGTPHGYGFHYFELRANRELYVCSGRDLRDEGLKWVDYEQVAITGSIVSEVETEESTILDQDAYDSVFAKIAELRSSGETVYVTVFGGCYGAIQYGDVFYRVFYDACCAADDPEFWSNEERLVQEILMIFQDAVSYELEIHAW